MRNVQECEFRIKWNLIAILQCFETMLILDNFRYTVQSCTEVDRKTCVRYRYTGAGAVD